MAPWKPSGARGSRTTTDMAMQWNSRGEQRADRDECERSATHVVRATSQPADGSYFAPTPLVCLAAYARMYTTYRQSTVLILVNRGEQCTFVRTTRRPRIHHRRPPFFRRRRCDPAGQQETLSGSTHRCAGITPSHPKGQSQLSTTRHQSR